MIISRIDAYNLVRSYALNIILLFQNKYNHVGSFRQGKTRHTRQNSTPRSSREVTTWVYLRRGSS
jgi:hypothetical protein